MERPDLPRIAWLSIIFVRFTHLKSNIPMKKLSLVLSFFLFTAYLTAQETYTVKGETLQLKIEVEGQLDLLWNTLDGHFRYFVRTSDNSITELVNTRDESRHFHEEYKTTLQNLTNRSADKVNLTLADLKVFIDDFNMSQDSNYESVVQRVELQLHLEVFGGVTNSPFFKNSTNALSPQIGIEMELDSEEMNRHALFMQLRHVFKTNDFDYSTTEMALGYRFRVINTKNLNLFIQTKFATLNFVNTVLDSSNDPLELNDTVFDIPLTFGVGADIRITAQSFISVKYSELFAALIDSQDHFSTNLTFGYKFNL